MRVVSYRVGPFVGLRHQFFRARDILSRNRIMGIIGVDQRGDLRRHRNRIARRDLFEIGKVATGTSPCEASSIGSRKVVIGLK